MAIVPTMDPYTASVIASGGMLAPVPAPAAMAAAAATAAVARSPYLPLAAAATPFEPMIVPPPLYQPMVVPPTTVLTSAPYAAAALGMVAPPLPMVAPRVPLPMQYPYDGFTAPLLPYY